MKETKATWLVGLVWLLLSTVPGRSAWKTRTGLHRQTSVPGGWTTSSTLPTVPLRILLALLVAAFTACVTGEPEVAGFLLEDFPAAGEPPRVVLVDAGTGEKSELRYLIAAGSVHEMVMTTSMRMSNPQGQELQAPGTRAVMVVEVVEADAERVQLDTSILSEPELVGTEGAPPELVAIMRQALRGMSSFRGRITMNRRGFAEESDFQVDTQDPMLQQFFESMKQSMSQLAIPFPEEAVGVGARWKMLQRMADPVTLYQVMSFELLGREGSSLTLAMKVTQLTPRQTMPLPQTLPGAPVDLSAEI